MRRSVESAEDIRVHLDGHIAFSYQLLIPALHTGLNPVSEGSTNDSICNVDDPLPWKLANIVLVGKVQESLWKLGRLGEKFFNTEALVLWHR